MLTLPWTLLLLLATPAASPQRPARSPTEAWQRLDETSPGGCDTQDLSFDYWPDGGIRNFYCRLVTVFPWHALITLTGRSPFVSGPHSAQQLNLRSEKTFGHYDPAFVRLIDRELIPATRDRALRAQTQPFYDKVVRTLARTYHAVYAKMRTRPSWVDAHVARYLKSLEPGQETEAFWELSSFMSARGFSDHPPDSEWGDYDPNLQRGAALFWLRRTVDHTAALFDEGLTTLLSTYDGAWLSAQRSVRYDEPPLRAVPDDSEE